MNLAPRNPSEVMVFPEAIKAKTIAVLLAPRLGDSLLTATIANNLQTNGKTVQVFGDYLFGLKKWFPKLQIQPSLHENDASSVLAGFDIAIEMHKNWPYDLHPYNRHVIEMDALLRVTGRDFFKLAQIVEFCNKYLGVANPSNDNGLRPPDITKWRSHINRIVLHPTSTGVQRCWAKEHFLKLALNLKDLGFDPNFIVSPTERPDWLLVKDFGLGLPKFSSLSDVAEFIYSSAWFIGNESGIGHLASNLGIPTFTLTGRPTRTRCWLPGWAPADFVYPWWIPGGRLRDKYWRTALSPNAVMHRFNKFRNSLGPSLEIPKFLLKENTVI